MKVTRVPPTPARPNYVVEMTYEEVYEFLSELSHIYPVPKTLYQLREGILDADRA